jgi:hypothetical protein
MSNGNLDGYNAVNTTSHASMAMPSSGKWYFEGVMTSGNTLNLGLASYRPNGHVYSISNSVLYSTSGVKNVDGVNDVLYGASWTTGDIIGVACDSDANTVTFYKNGVSQGAISHQVGGLFPSFGNGGIAVNYTVNFGQRPFAYTAPSGFKALNTANLPAPVITKPSDLFDVKLYTGTGSNQSITGLGFSPDFVWIKSRSTAEDNNVFDVVRGPSSNLYALQTNSAAAEGQYNTMGSLDSNGFSLTGGGGATNFNGTSYVAWTWDAGTSTVTNTQGSISSQVRANASAGFSIVTWTGDGVGGRTVGHGLGVAPAFVVIKQRIAGPGADLYNWNSYHAALGATQFIALNTTDSASTAPLFNDTAPTSTVFSLGSSTSNYQNVNNASGVTYVAYCWAPLVGYSSMGSYTGDGSTSGFGPFIHCGFRPKFVLIKGSSVAQDWLMLDAVRNPYNLTTQVLYANSSTAEMTNNGTGSGGYESIDILSNGFQIKSNSSRYNQSGATYIYFAVAESPFQYARAR